MKSLKFSCTLFLSISNYSNIFSNSFKKFKDKWQFVRYSQDPFLDAS